MVSLEELVNRNDPKIGRAFVQKLKLPNGMFSFPNVMEANEPNSWSSQSACFRPDINIQALDNLLGAAAVSSWKDRQDELLDQLFGKFDVAADLPSPAEVYHRFWKYPVTGVVMVAQVRRTKFSVSEPFLLSVTFPTVLPRGYTGDVFQETSPTARFMPGQGLLPQQGKMPFICGAAHALRTYNNVRDEKLQPEEILADYIVGFGQKAFSHLVVPVNTIMSDQEAEPLRSLTQAWEELLQEPSGSIPSDTRIVPSEVNTGATPVAGLRLPMMLPLIGPLQLPAGIIGHPSISIDGVKLVLKSSDNPTGGGDPANDWLQHPMVRAWFAAAARFAPEMSIEVASKNVMADSICYPPDDAPVASVHLANPLMLDYWRSMEATLFFRYWLDAVIGSRRSTRTGSLFYKYLVNASVGLYHENNILGRRPVDVGFEVLLLRPPVASGKRGSPTFREFMAPWKLDAFFCPTFLCDYKVQPVDYSAAVNLPLQRADNQKDPAFADAPDFGPAPPTVHPFPPDDPRIADPANDTEAEKYERSLLAILDLEPEDDPSDDLFPEQSEQYDEALRELEELRTRPLAQRPSDSAHWVTKSDQQKQNAAKRPPMVDPFEFLLRSSTKRQRPHSQPAGPSTPPRPDQQSGFRPPNVQQPNYRDPADVKRKLDNLQPPPADTNSSNASSANDDDEPEVVVDNPLQKLLNIFVTPPGETAQTAIVLDSGTHEALMARLRRRHPFADKDGNTIPLTRHLLLADEVSTSAMTSSSTASGRKLTEVDKWTLSETGTGTPPMFTFWSLLLVFHEPHFQGTIEGGKKHRQPVDPDWCLFPAMLGSLVRNQFLVAEPKDLEGWVQSCAGKARRDACFAQSARMGWMQPGPFLGSISRDVLHQFRLGLWNCASYYERDSAPAKSNFCMFSMLTTRAVSATNLLPATGLNYDECLDVLRNTFFLLALPVTQGLPNSSPELVEAVLDRTVLLSVLRRFLDRLCDDPRSFHSASLRSFWTLKCDARAKNALAFTIFSYVDELLSLLGACVTDPTPSIRLAHDSDDNSNLYLIVDPTIRNPALLQSVRVRSAAQPLIQSALAIWETAAWSQIEQYIRGEPHNIPSAPSCYVESTKKQPPTKGDGDHQGKNQTPPRNKGKKGRTKAAISILQWGPRATPAIKSATSGLNDLLQNNRPHPRFPAAGDGNTNSKLICFAYSMAEHEGCLRGSKCKFAHVDGVSSGQSGPAAFGSLTQYLERPEIKDVIVYTDTGRRLAGN